MISRESDLIVVEEFGEKLPRPKTKEMVAAIARWGIESEAKLLLILPEKAETVYLSGRNIANLRMILATNLNVFDILNADKIVTTPSAMAKIQEVYGE